MTEKEIQNLLDVIDSRSNSKKEFYCGKIIDDSFLDTDKDKTYYKAVNLNGTGVHNDNDYFCLLNKTGEDLNRGDSVLIHAINGDLSNAYIMQKFGKPSKTVVAYEFSGGNDNVGNDDIALDYDTKKAKFAEIFFRDQEYNYNYVKIENPYNKTICLSIMVTNSEGQNIWVKTKRIRIDDYVIWNLQNLEISIINSSQNYVNYIYITKVILHY